MSAWGEEEEYDREEYACLADARASGGVAGFRQPLDHPHLQTLAEKQTPGYEKSSRAWGEHVLNPVRALAVLAFAQRGHSEKWDRYAREESARVHGSAAIALARLSSAGGRQVGGMAAIIRACAASKARSSASRTARRASSASPAHCASSMAVPTHCTR